MTILSVKSLGKVKGHARVLLAMTTFSSVPSLSRVHIFVTPRTAACQASPSITNSWSLLKLMPIGSVMPSSHLILCRPLLLLPAVFPSVRVFSSEWHQHALKGAPSLGWAGGGGEVSVTWSRRWEGLWTAVTQRKFSCGFGVRNAEDSRGEQRKEVNLPYFT